MCIDMKGSKNLSIDNIFFLISFPLRYIIHPSIIHNVLSEMSLTIRYGVYNVLIILMPTNYGLWQSVQEEILLAASGRHQFYMSVRRYRSFLPHGDPYI